MSTVILLSSSPPRVFAPSPTPIGSSSPLPSTAALVQGRSPSSKKFKTNSKERDSFTTVFTTARHVLAEKTGAENAFVSSPGRNKFRPSQEDSVEEHASKDLRRKRSGKDRSVATRITKPGSQALPVETARLSKKCSTTKPIVEADVNKRLKKPSPEPLLLERAAARKLDWTPPKAAPYRHDDEKPVEYSAGLMNGMLNSFTYPDTSKDVDVCRSVQTPNPAKRRRVEHSTDDKQVNNMPQKRPLPDTSLAGTKAAPKKSRSPAKKALTITGLATSNYLGQNETDESPMMQYLISTQAQLHEAVTDAGLETKIQKTKVAARKLKGSKKVQPKSLLLSPTSAMKTYDEQEAIFGSASQLAREESPTFLRETIEAMKQSESFVVSDPFSSPQRTQPISIENTPQTGVSRFRKTRNLWAAAGRDEDNALLHVDTVDLTDTPAVRAAFAGKDVMLQPGTGSTSLSKPNVSLRGGYSPLDSNQRSGIIDIGEMDAPQLRQTRSLSSTRVSTGPRQSPMHTAEEFENEDHEPAAIVTAKEKPPLKPNYAGFTTQDLNKQIKSYGFKAMRKREKMIELLDRCWEEKYGPLEEVALPKTPVVPFGDILSKVHDLSARPEPKVKKARVSKAKNASVEATKKKTVRKPRESKQNDEGAQTKAKAPRKRKSKATTVDSESVVDLDNVWSTIPEELRALEAFDDWARPEQKKSKTQGQSVENTRLEQRTIPASPAALPLDNNIETHETGVPTIVSETSHSPKKVAAVTSQTPLSEKIASQITVAIMHQSQSAHPGRNHNINPTWHEKLLLYDPIVLEDMAAWLNTEGLGAIGEDREVSATDVREWCELRGICCLWRGGWRGNKLAQS